MINIMIESPDAQRTVVPVTDFPCVVGRRRNCQVVLASWRVAARHAEIRRSGTLLTVVDAGTLGGTWVNGERVAEFGPLTQEDEILIAGFSLRLTGLATDATPDEISDAADDGLATDGDAPAVAALYGRGDTGRSGGANPAGNDQSLELRRRLHRQLLSRMDLRRQEIRHLDAVQLREQVGSHLQVLIDAQEDLRDLSGIDQLRQAVIDEAVGLGPLEPLLAREDVTEIMVNGCDPVYIETGGKLVATDLRFSSAQAIEAVIERIVSPLGRRIDESSPMVDARLPDGSRVNAVVPPLAVKGPAITIRRFSARRFTAQDLVTGASASAPMMAFLAWCVKNRANVVVSGGTGSGKTTLLNVLSSHIGLDERIVTIEDAAELRLDHPHLVSLEARPPNSEDRGAVSIRDLVRNALRMRPDRIVVGECRGGEALDMLQAMNTGHDGSLTTVHANSARDALARLEVMVLMSGVDMPVGAIREQVCSAVDVIVQQQRGRDGRRRIVEVVEVGGMDGPTIQSQPLFRYERQRDQFVATGHIPSFLDQEDPETAAQVRALLAPQA